MARPYTLADRDVPAEVREHMPLFDWAREQAAAVRVAKERIDEKRVNLATVTEIVEESEEFKDVEDAREELKRAKASAIDRDADVEAAAERLATARKALSKVSAFKKARELKGGIKALETVVVETKDRIASALDAGKVPQAVEVVIERGGPAQDPR